MNAKNEIEIGTLVQTIFGSRICKVIAIDTVNVIDRSDATKTYSHTEPRYHLEYGQHDFLNGLKPLTPGSNGKLTAIRSEIEKVL